MKNIFDLKIRGLRVLLFILLIHIQLLSQIAFDPDTVKSGKYDTGKMWTFEFPPYEYFKEVHGFEVTKEWFDDVRLSALRIPGCSASFVSGDGLIMTNNHCAGGVQRLVEREGEDLAKTGFYAATLEEERKIPNYNAEQLIFLKDVTQEVQDAISAGKDQKEKIELRDKKMKELKAQHEKETGLKCDVISYYNGSLFFVQGFRVYKDVRLVFKPEEQIGYFGGDPDNFTFPRYNLDCTFMRIYDEDGKPLKTENYFAWSKNGAEEGELVFTVGNPGSTNRLRTVAQLEYLRDITYRNFSFQSDKLYKKIEELKKINPGKADYYESYRLGFSNGWKSLTSTYKALNDPYLFARKKNFENKMRNFVQADPELKKQYGTVWSTIEKTRSEMRKVEPVISSFTTSATYSSRHLLIADALVYRATQMLLPEEQRDSVLKSDRYKQFLKNIYPENFDALLEMEKLKINLDFIKMNLGENHQAAVILSGGKTTDEAAEYLTKNSPFTGRDAVKKLLELDPSELLAMDNPLIKYYVYAHKELPGLRDKQRAINAEENLAFGMVGQVLFNLYGTSVTPDANRTLRISDGLMAGYNYNGTVAPVFTSFYGLYDRFFSFRKKYPFNLPERWSTIPSDLDLSTPFNFVATNDIVGGNSGSPVINKNAEIIGLAFDGNIESLQGNFIYLPEFNRTVAVDSRGMLEAIDKVYKAKRLADELKSGKMN